ncbi:MAG TPA: NUDIX domain-containing protein [Candidatus Saccharimonadales bacterium]|nr:NUDIX domain-containing protein [Candidatus Saccharimonadales bacterium]
MKKQSAGIVLYRKTAVIEVFLAHPGGPFWAKKDAAAWSIPKGEYQDDEDELSAAKREFKEETGQEVPGSAFVSLGDFKVTSNKIVKAWAAEGDIDPKHVKSNTFEMEWPPKSGKTSEFPEVDKVAWFPLAVAVEKVTKGQVQIIEKLAELLGVDIATQITPDADAPANMDDSQISLF